MPGPRAFLRCWLATLLLLSTSTAWSSSWQVRHASGTAADDTPAGTELLPGKPVTVARRGDSLTLASEHSVVGLSAPGEATLLGPGRPPALLIDGIAAVRHQAPSPLRIQTARFVVHMNRATVWLSTVEDSHRLCLADGTATVRLQPGGFSMALRDPGACVVLAANGRLQHESLSPAALERQIAATGLHASPPARTATRSEPPVEARPPQAQATRQPVEQPTAPSTPSPTVLRPEPPRWLPPATYNGPQRWYVIIGSYQGEDRARLDALRATAPHAHFAHTLPTPQMDGVYRAAIGPYPDRESAQAGMRHMRQTRPGAWIIGFE